MPERAKPIDFAIIALRSKVEQETAEIISQARTNSDVEITHGDVFAIRQFIGWHRLRFGMRPDAANVSKALAEFVYDCGIQANVVGKRIDREQLHQQLIAAGLRRTKVAMTVQTLKRRISSIARIFEAASRVHLRKHKRVSGAIAVVQAAKRDPVKNPLTAPEHVRAELLATCDDTVLGVRDRALLATWFATGCSLAVLLRSNEEVLMDAIATSPNSRAREQAFNAIMQWSSISELYNGPLFRRIRADGRLGAPISPKTAQQIVIRRWALAEGRAKHTARAIATRRRVSQSLVGARPRDAGASRDREPAG